MVDSGLTLGLAEAIDRTGQARNSQLGVSRKNDEDSLIFAVQQERCSYDLRDFSQGTHFRGCVERIDQTSIKGWCVDVRAVGDATPLKALFFGVVIGEVVARDARPDVQAVVGQPCTPGFDFPLLNCRIAALDFEAIRLLAESNADDSAALEMMTIDGDLLLPRITGGLYGLTNGEMLTVLRNCVVEDREAGIPQKAPGNPALICSAFLEDVVVGVPSPRGSVLRGVLERIDEQGVVGWCLDSSSLAEPVPLKLAFLGVELQQFSANQSRGDVENAVGHACSPGFSMRWSSVQLNQIDVATLFTRVIQAPQALASIEVLTVDDGIRVERIAASTLAMTNIQAFATIIVASWKSGGDVPFLNEFLDAFLSNESLFPEEWAVVRSLFNVDSLQWTVADSDIDRTSGPAAFRAYVKSQCALHGPLFDDRHYVYLNPDVLASGFPPLLHYALYGRKIGLQPHLLFMPKALEAQSSSVGASAATAYFEFLTRKSAENWHSLVDIGSLRANPKFSSANNAEILIALHDGAFSPTPLFDADFYIKSCQLRNVTFDQAPLYHYMMMGWKLGIDPHPLFDSKYYLVDQGSVDKLYNLIDPLTLFIQSNNESRFSPSPFLDLLHLRHHMSLKGYVYASDARLLIDALKSEWISAHPHLQEAMVGFLTHADETSVLKEPLTTMADLCRLVGAIRLGLLPMHEAGHQPPAPNAAAEALVSVIILNYNKPVYTLLSAYSAWVAVAGTQSEVLVVDNGSSPYFVELLYRYLAYLPSVRVISNRKNLFFGEGNNVALDTAVGKYILFLNNDAVIRRETLQRLVASMEEDASIGLMAPVLLLPDRRVQEAGGIISGCGQVIQESKYIPFQDFYRIFAKRKQVRVCDYASAACSLLRREVARKVLGFDMMFEPFYFEDTDFCVRVRAQGYQVAIHRGAYAFHFENASTSEFLGRSMMEVIDRQRMKFRKRWFGVFEEGELSAAAETTARYASASRYEVLTPQDVKPGYSGKPVAWVYSPYEIRVGGGERYILSLAQVLSHVFEVWFLTPGTVSRARLAMTMDDLAIQSGRFHTATLEDTANWPRPELYVSMGNEIEPPTPGFGRRNLFHCQYPFPIHHTGPFAVKRIHGYDGVVVNSRYTANAVEQMLKVYNVPARPIYVLSPPVPVPSEEQQARILSQKSWDAQSSLAVNIGRFMAGGHNKRQDIVLNLAERCQSEKLPIKFELYGGLNSSADDQAFFAGLVEQAARTKAVLRMNAARSEIEAALTNAFLYIHPCGMGCYPSFKPEQVEHFGITVVEAMAHGVLPLVYKWGGPAEIVSETGVGATFETMDDAFNTLKGQLDRPADELRYWMAQAMKQSHRYSETSFQNSLLRIVEIVAQAR